MTLESFNASYAASYNNMAKDFDRYARTLRQMKEDLDSIFRRIKYVLVAKRALLSLQSLTRRPPRIVRTRLGLPEPPPVSESDAGAS